MRELLESALLHLPHIGPVRRARLADSGCATWSALLAAADPLRLGPGRWTGVREAARASLSAVRDDDPRALTRLLRAGDHWRILAHWFERASFFDIETSGLEVGSQVTVVVCLHEGRLHRFVRGENLDDFLPLLDEVKLMVSFNGTGFDVPRIMDLFHIPAFPCAHVDLRWMCHHAGWRGGLKAIERQRGLDRPGDLSGIGGAEAVWLWTRWQETRNEAARRRLLRYCAADTVALHLLAGQLLATHGLALPADPPSRLWTLVDRACPLEPGDESVRPSPDAPPVPSWPGAAGLGDLLRANSGATVTSRAEKQRRLREKWRALRGQGVDAAWEAASDPQA